MVLLNLTLRVISENAKELRINGETYDWCFIIECDQCHTEQPNEIYFTAAEEVEMEKGHGTANFAMKCKFCKKALTISINNKANKSAYSINCENGNDEGILCSFDCRGSVIRKWIPKDGVSIEAAETHKVFENVDITSEWCDYDECSQGTVSLLEPVASRFEKD